MQGRVMAGWRHAGKLGAGACSSGCVQAGAQACQLSCKIPAAQASKGLTWCSNEDVIAPTAIRLGGLGCQVVAAARGTVAGLGSKS